LDVIVVLLIFGFVLRSVLKQKTNAQKAQRPHSVQQPRVAQRPRIVKQANAVPPARTAQQAQVSPQTQPTMQPRVAQQMQPRHNEYVPTQAEGFAGEGDKARYHTREVSCQSAGHAPAQHATAAQHVHIEHVETQAEGFAGEGDPGRYHSRKISCQSAGHTPPAKVQPKLSLNQNSLMQSVIWAQILDKPHALRSIRRF
jgi:hypothetical protein